MADEDEIWAPRDMTASADGTFNPIRAIVDVMDTRGNPDLPLIPLSIGDPTVFGNMGVPENVVETMVANLRSGKYNGYPHSVGYPAARQAVATHSSGGAASYTTDDVILASGCSGALELAIAALADPGQNILIPKPGFSLYKTICGNKGIETRSYKLLPEAAWEVDLADMEALIDAKTAAIIVTNPSNPCGSVFSKSHILDILKIAAKHKIPIISDEVYAEMVFSGATFHAFASLATNVPVLSCGGLAKRFLVPGWRMGWVLVHDPVNAFANVRAGLLKLSQVILGSCSLIQSVLPTIFKETPTSFLEDVMGHLEGNSKLIFDTLSQVKGLIPVMPQGAMYFMVGVDVAQFKDIKDDRDFTQKLLKEQSVFCLPASVFEYPNYFRIVTTIPKERMQEAMDRIKAFCDAHRI